MMPIIPSIFIVKHQIDRWAKIDWSDYLMLMASGKPWIRLWIRWFWTISKYVCSFWFGSQPYDVSVVNLIQPKVTVDRNSILCAAYTELEIKTALFHMYPTKAESSRRWWYASPFLSTLLGLYWWRHCGGSSKLSSLGTVDWLNKFYPCMFDSEGEKSGKDDWFETHCFM